MSRGFASLVGHGLLAVNLCFTVHRIKHYLADEDAALCLEGKQCVSLGLEFGQFVYGIS